MEAMWDLPSKYIEFFCLNCGERFWYDKEKLTIKISIN